MRCSAWWHAQRRAKSAKDAPPGSRLEQGRAERREPRWQPNLPEAKAAYMVGYLWDVGPALPGPTPLTYAEIGAWQERVGVPLSAWEARILRRLSAEYVGELARAADPTTPSPAAPALSDEDRARISKQVAQGLRMLKNTRPKR